MLKRNRSKAGVGQQRSPKQEAETAARVGGKVTPGSGNKDVKGDVRSAATRIECKTTTANSFRVTREMLRKIDEAAAGSAQLPFIEVEFLSQAGEPIGAVCVCPKWVLEYVADVRRGPA